MSIAPPPDGYWYRGDADAELLRAVRRFRRADEGMRRRMSAEMGVNPLDLRALRLVIASERGGSPITPHQLGAQLHVSSGAMTKLVDRLIRSDHLSRSPNPQDRRSVRLVATPHAHEQLRERMTEMHEQMARVAAAVPQESRAAVVTFLDELSAVLGDQARPAPRS